jgi:hypothetical protein
MNISSLTTLDLLLGIDTTSVASTVSAASTSSTTKGSTATSDSQESDGVGAASDSPLFKDTVQLLKDLASGDTGAAKADIANLEAALKDREALPAGSQTSDRSLGKLLDTLSTSLESGNSSGALNTLAGYLIGTGNSTGTLVNTTA